MNPRTLLLALVALSLAGATAMFARQWLNAQRTVIAAAPAEAPKATSTEVLVARDNLPAGSFVKPENLRWQSWPDANVAQSYVVNGKGDMNAFVGAVVRQGIAAGEPITSLRVVKPGDRGFLAAVLAPGMRAVSVSVNAQTGISGFVFPGDRVDVILAHGVRESDAEQKNVTRRASETVLSDIRVIAIDQNASDQPDKPAVSKTVTIEVTPKEAEVVAVASELGKLSLSLRALAGSELAVEPPRGPTWDAEVSSIIGRAGEKEEIAVMRGSKSEAVAIKGGTPKAIEPAPEATAAFGRVPPAPPPQGVMIVPAVANGSVR